jgi:putative transposase
MSLPRQVLPGTTYLVTRRCSQRELLLKPSPTVNALFLYLLAVAASRFGVLLHAYCVLSNHYHLVVTDPGGRLPAFVQYLDSLVARALNAAHGRWESFWAPNTFSAVALASVEDVVAKCAYVLANPVAAGLVRTGSEWPGVWSGSEGVGSMRIAVPRPAGFFRDKGPMPASSELALAVPPGFDSAPSFRSVLATAVDALEESARREHDEQGRGFLGVARVLRQDCRSRPSSRERRRNLDPRHAAADKWKRIEALCRLAEFVHSYRDAWSRLRAGARDVLFPAGTYALRIHHRVRCAPA